MKTVEYWKPRLKFFTWHTAVFGIVTYAAGYYTATEYSKNPSVQALLPIIVPLVMALLRLWNSLYKERK